jgi:hypothetical protein
LLTGMNSVFTESSTVKKSWKYGIVFEKLIKVVLRNYYF